jgi:NADH dehydrogenase
MSAIGADPKSQSAYGRSKGEGEAAVCTAFPAASIFRPSLVFGPEDQLTNRFAGMGWLPLLPVIAAQRRFQPVYVRDLAQAIAQATLQPEQYGGKIFEIGGPQVMTMRELNEAVLEASGQSPDLIDMPDFMASALSRFGFLPGAPLTRDQWLMLQRDNVPAKGAPGLDAFGIKPTPLGAVAHEWLSRFHKGGRFAGRRVNLTATS